MNVVSETMCNLFLHTSKTKQKFKIQLKFFPSSWWTFEHTWCSTRTGLRTFQKYYSTMDYSYNNVNFNDYNFDMFYCTRYIWCCISSSSDENQVRKLTSVFWNCDKLITFILIIQLAMGSDNTARIFGGNRFFHFKYGIALVGRWSSTITIHFAVQK